LKNVSRRAFLLTTIVAAILLSATAFASNSIPVVETSVTYSWPGGLTINHTNIVMDLIPSEYIEGAMKDVNIHYAHTSHGGQITTGLTRLEAANATFDVSITSLALPEANDTLSIYDGNAPHTYITPDLYWEGLGATDITQNTIDSNPNITVSLWSWCTQVDYYANTSIQNYLDTMTALEAANPDVTFIYMTGNAQGTGSSGFHRWENNQMIRQYCLDNDKILFDFADLDCWSNGDQNTYDYNPGDGTIQVPVEHTDFNGNEAGHTTYTSCEQKGRAFWWLVAMLAGWNAPETTTTTTTSATTTSSIPTTQTTSVTTSVTDPISEAPDLMVIGTGLGLIGILGVLSLLWSRRR
jgi:hypothetical protein